MPLERTMVNIYLPALERSATGSIVSMIRFMPETQSELRVIGADLFDLTPDLASDFCDTLTEQSDKEEKRIQEKFKEMLLDTEDYNHNKYKKRRVFNIVIEGEDAIERINTLMGDIHKRNGVTISGRYGFYQRSADKKVISIEFPASAPTNKEEAEAQIDLIWNKYRSCGGPLEDSIVYPPDKQKAVERSVVLVKPNAFNNPNDPRLGDVMDTISRTGMYIIGAKVQKPNRAQTEKFYAAHKGKEFFDGLVDFMSEKKSLALLYEGVTAREEIRHAALTVIRDAYSDSKLENTVHTSENEEDFKRESEAVDFSNNKLIEE